MNSNIVDKLKWRYATKKFDTSKKLSEEKIEILKQAFNLTATSYGLQTLKMLVIEDIEIKKELVPMSMGQEMVKEASHVLVICMESSLTSEYIQNYFKRVEETRDTPRDILKPFEEYLIEEFAQKSDSEVEIWMQKQAYIALGNLLTVCALEEIDSVPMEGFDPKKYDKLHNLKEKGLKSVLVLPVGYRADDDIHADLKKVRRGVDEVVISYK